MPTIRLATFNLENLDDVPGERPTLAERIAVLRPQLLRLRADILCLQEVHGQEQAGQPRRLLALDQLLAGTPYAAFQRVNTLTADGVNVYDVRNLVILSRFPLANRQQILHDLIPRPAYKKVTADPPEPGADDVTWERPLLRVDVLVPGSPPLHVINLHLKSKLPSNIPGQKLDQFRWRTISGWAEGYFLSAVKRVGQALETRALIDQLFNGDPSAWIAVCGDFNAESDDVPLEAIRGEVENTQNEALGARLMVPCERTVPESARFSLYHRGRGAMLDHILASRALLAHYRTTEIHNEVLHDESQAFADDKKFPESDHAPVVAEFEVP